MLVHGAIIPPAAVLGALDAVVRSVPVPVEAVASSPAQPRGIIGRLGRHRDEAPDVVAEAPVMLEHVSPDRMLLPITGFGNLTTTDSNRLVDALTSTAAGWPTPTVRFAGGTALDFPGDWSVWAKLDGDLDAVGAIARGVTQRVESLGFFVDRRQFRPMLSVATVTPATTGPFLQAVVDALEAFRGEEWTVAISLTTETFVEGRPSVKEFRRIPLAQ